MKTLTYCLLAFLLALFMIESCTKSALAGHNGQLVASKYAVKIYESDSVLLVGASATDSIKWSVSPSGANYIITKGNAALLQFKKAGSYTVSATDNGGTPATAVITVADTVGQPATAYQTVSLANTPIILVPKYYKSPSADSTYIFFEAQIGSNYCLNSTLNETSTLLAGGGYSINFAGVQQPLNCTANGGGPYFATVYFGQTQGASLVNGTFPLNVTVSGTAYTGTVTIASTTITFHWNYTSGIVISPMHINR